MIINRALTPIFLLFAFSVQAQPCKVLDPEIQGVYSGSCVSGLAEGEGFAKGAAEYRGSFKAGRKDGRGVKTWPNGDRYEGEFVADRKEGYGSSTGGPMATSTRARGRLIGRRDRAPK
jgi:hypothetical protein